MNWSSAALQYTEDSELLARISNVHELCDAQTALTTVDAQYWTALKSDSSGNFHWGLLNTTAILDPAELLDDTQPGHCYVISASSMKLVAMDCNSLQGVLTTYNDDQEGKWRLREIPAQNNDTKSAPEAGIPMLAPSIQIMFASKSFCTIYHQFLMYEVHFKAGHFY